MLDKLFNLTHVNIYVSRRGKGIGGESVGNYMDIETFDALVPADSFISRTGLLLPAY